MTNKNIERDVPEDSRLPVDKLSFFWDLEDANSIVSSSRCDSSLSCIGVDPMDSVLVTKQSFDVASTIRVPNLKKKMLQFCVHP